MLTDAAGSINLDDTIQRTNKTTAFHNGMWNALGNLVNLSAGIIGSLIVVRTLSTTGYGALSFYLWLSSTLGVVGLLAFPHGHTKIVSEMIGEDNRKGANDLSAWATGIVVLYNLSVVASVIIYALFWAPIVSKPFLFIVSAILIPNSLSTMLGSRLSALGRYSWSSMAVQVSSVIQLGLLVWGYIHHWSVQPFMFILLSPTLFQFFILLCGNGDSLRIYLRMFRRPHKVALSRYVQFLIPMTLVVLYERIVWDRSEILFLKMFSTTEQIGYYNLGFTIFGMFLNLGLALINGYWPAISTDHGAGKIQSIRVKVKKGVTLSLLYAVPLTFGGMITLPSIISIMYGHKMAPSGVVTMVLIIGLIPGVLNGMFSLTLSACGHVWANVKTGLGTSLSSVILDIVLVKHFGAFGGSIACAVSQLMNCLILMFIVLKRLEVSLPWRKFGEIIAIGAVTTMVIPSIILLIHPGIIGLVVSIVVAAGCYGSCVYKLGYLHLVRERRYQNHNYTP